MPRSPLDRFAPEVAIRDAVADAFFWHVTEVEEGQDGASFTVHVDGQRTFEVTIQQVKP